MRYTREGWLQEKKQDEGADMSRLRALMNSLSVSKEWLLHGNRVVIPTRLQPQVLELLHTGHFGMVRMKKLTRTLSIGQISISTSKPWAEIVRHLENINQSHRSRQYTHRCYLKSYGVAFTSTMRSTSLDQTG